MGHVRIRGILDLGRTSNSWMLGLPVGNVLEAAEELGLKGTATSLGDRTRAGRELDVPGVLGGPHLVGAWSHTYCAPEASVNVSLQ